MDKYINKYLAMGIIEQFTSPLDAGFFFVGKKDGSVRPLKFFGGYINCKEQVSSSVIVICL